MISKWYSNLKWSSLSLTRKSLAVTLALVFTNLIFLLFFFNYSQKINNRQRVINLASETFRELSNLQSSIQAGTHDAVDSDVLQILNRLDLNFQILVAGGRMKNNEGFIDPPNSITKISGDRLMESWVKYKKLIEDKAGAYQKENINVEINDTLANVPSRILSENQYSSDNLSRLKGAWGTIQERYNFMKNDLDEEYYDLTATSTFIVVFFVGMNCLFAGFIFFFFYKKVIQPVIQIGNGNFFEWIDPELQAIQHAQKNLRLQISNASTFIQSIGSGELQVDYSGKEEDILAGPLKQMKHKLLELNFEENKRAWANEGLRKFVEILRTNDNHLQALGDRIISSLVNYTKANQGALYIVTDDNGNLVLELLSLFAFNIKKYKQQKVLPGEGLLGQAYLEQDIIYLTEIPQDYIRITSGLGDTNPDSILIVPLKTDKEVLGIVELASLRKFEKHEIDFVSKLGETIASTLEAVRTSQKTKKLLDDLTAKTEQMHAQEEEMRQNMEELSASQEEVVRKEKEYLQKIKLLEDQLSVRQPDREWEVANEVHQTLKFSLEALKIMPSSDF